MFKAAFFDIDGTLLSFQTHRVSEGTKRAFHRLHKGGVMTFLSTGRPKILIPEMPVGFEAYITMNGGLVFNEDAVLLDNPIVQEETERWLDIAERHGLCTMQFTQHGMMLAQPNEAGLRLRDQLEFPMPPVGSIQQMRGRTTYQIIALMPPEMDKEVGEALPNCKLPRWHPAFTDIVASGNSKAVGMDAICRHYGIRREDTIAFGDGGNDVEMLEWAGVGVAMGNADDGVKAHADMVTTSVDDEGIERAIELLL